MIISKMETAVTNMNTAGQSGYLTDCATVGRFAPSPSGRMHLGNVFSALIAWLSVRAAGGRMILRIEDLDPRCANAARAEQIIDDLHWLGLDWDEGPIYQHDRLDLYRDAVARLEKRGLVYPCFCTRAELHAASAPHASDGTPVYAGTCRDLTPQQIEEKRRVRPAALRLRVPEEGAIAGTISFIDRVYGAHTEVLARDCGDFLVQRSDGVFAYQLVVVVDDAEMGVTEVVRGRDLLGSAPRQMYLQHLLGYEQPTYAHVPMLIAPDGRRLSKREHDCDLGELKRTFGTPERLLGRLAAAAGLAPDATPRSAEQLIDLFNWDILRVHARDIVVDNSFFV